MTRAAQVVFVAIVAATFGAFFLTQRLKHGPAVIQDFGRTWPVFSPNGDGRKDAERYGFRIKRSDDVTVDVVDREGDAVRRLLDDRPLKAYARLSLRWDGRGDGGRRVADGRYRLRITLRKEGRSIVVPRVVVVDTRPPTVRVYGGRGSSRRGPLLLPGAPVEVRFATNGGRRRVQLFRTAPGPVAKVGGAVALPGDATRWRWDGTVDGATAPQGTYVAVVEAFDTAGNLGTSVPLAGPERLPRAGYGDRLPGGGGITVRRLAVQPPSVPVVAGQTARIFVDARRRRWTATLSRVGDPTPIRRYAGARVALALRVPARAQSGAYLLTVTTADARERVPVLVQSTQRHRVLVLAPWITWQGHNAVDDDGDGLVDTLDRGVGVRADRVFAGDGLPRGFAVQEAPLLAELDRRRRRFDLTSDWALATGKGPALSGYGGVLVPGDARWLPPAVQRALLAFVRGGGTLVSLGTQSLRAQAATTAHGRVVRPTPVADTDLFGARIGGLTAGPADLTILGADPIGLFKGGTGSFDGVRAFEPTLGLGPRATRLSAAVDGRGRAVIVAERVGKGTVVRTGSRELAARLRSSSNLQALVGRLWTLLSR